MKKKSSMGPRKRARRIALQGLYGWSMTNNSINDIEKHILLQHENEDFDKEYFQILLHQIPLQYQQLETLFIPYLIDHTIEELDLVERNVLRIATYEFQERLEIPYRVVINEALELTKTFGSTEGYKFVNGVLDKLAHDLRKTEIKGD